MPYMKNGKRDYKLENLLYNSRPEQRHNRSLRTTARNEAIAEGRVQRGDGRDVAHVVALSKGGSNARSNTRIESAGSNRSFERNSDSTIKSERSKRERRGKK